MATPFMNAAIAEAQKAYNEASQEVDVAFKADWMRDTYQRQLDVAQRDIAQHQKRIDELKADAQGIQKLLDEAKRESAKHPKEKADAALKAAENNLNAIKKSGGK